MDVVYIDKCQYEIQEQKEVYWLISDTGAITYSLMHLILTRLNTKHCQGSR
jgi:hypothetical protein